MEEYPRGVQKRNKFMTIFSSLIVCSANYYSLNHEGLFEFWPCHYLCKGNNFINLKELAELSDWWQKYKGKYGNRIGTQAWTAWVHIWTWHLKVLCSEVSDENHFWSRKAGLQRKVRRPKVVQGGVRRKKADKLSAWKNWLSGGREQRQDLSTTVVRKEKLANFIVCQLSKEIEQSVCQESWCPFQPNVGFSDLLLLHCTPIPDFIPSLNSCMFKGSFAASFPFVDAYS